MQKVTKSAERLSNIALPKPKDVIQQRITKKAWGLVATNTTCTITLETFPSWQFCGFVAVSSGCPCTEY